MADREIELKFTSDTKKAKKGAKEVKKSVDDIGKSKGIKEVNKDLDETKKKGKEAADAVKRIPKGQGKVRMPKPEQPSQDEQKFKTGVKAMREEIKGLAAEYAHLSTQAAKVNAAYRQELNSLDENADGYEETKAALEKLIVQGETLEKSLITSKATVDKYAISLNALGKSARKMGFDKALTELDKMGLNVGIQQKNFEVLEQRSSNFAEAWSNRQAKANKKAQQSAERLAQAEQNAATKRANAEKKAQAAQRKTQAQLDLTRKSYPELIALLSQYQAKVKAANSPEQYAAANLQLKLIKQRLREVGREATLTGSKAIASAKSFEAMAKAFTKGAVTGRASIGAMIGSLNMFLKAHLAMTAVSFLWGAFEDQISSFLDEWKQLDPTTEKNKEKMQELAEAVRDAGRAAIEAGFALSDKLHSDEANRKADIAIMKIEREGELFDANKTALEKLSKARAADMELAARAADDESALKRLEIENDFINGRITATEKAITLKKLELEAAAAADQLSLDKAKEELKLRQQLNDEAAKSVANAEQTVIDVRARGSRMMNAEEIAKYEADRKAIEEELRQLAEADRVATSDADRATNQARRRELQNILKRLEEKRNAAGRNTVAEYEAWQRELDAALEAAESLTEQYNQLNAQMYEQRENVAALEKETKRKAETRKRIADAENKNLQDEEKQTARDKQNKKQIADLKNKLDKMTLAELQAEQRTMQNRIARTKNTKKRERLEGVAETYAGEIEKRLDRARGTVEKATQGKYARTDKEQTVMTQAAALLEKIAANEQYTRADFNAAKELLMRATRTTGTADDSVVYQLIEYMNATATAINKNRQQNAKLGNEVARLKNKLSDPSK